MSSYTARAEVVPGKMVAHYIFNEQCLLNIFKNILIFRKCIKKLTKKLILLNFKNVNFQFFWRDFVAWENNPKAAFHLCFYI